MTKSWFDENVNWWPELVEAARDEGYDAVSDYIFTDDGRNEYINDELYNDDSDWRSIRDWLYGLDDSYYDFWFHDDWGEWSEADDETFFRFKTDFMDWMDDGGYWDEEETDEDYDANGSVGDDACEIPDEDFTVSDLFSECSHFYESDRIKQAEMEAYLKSAAIDAETREAEEMDRAWIDFIKATEVA